LTIALIERLVGSRTRGSRAKHGAAGSRPFTSYTFHSLPGQPRGARRSVKLVLAAVIGGRWHSQSWLPYTGAWPRAPSTRGSRRDRPSCASQQQSAQAPRRPQIRRPARRTGYAATPSELAPLGTPGCQAKVGCAWMIRARDRDDAIRGSPRSIPCSRPTRERRRNGRMANLAKTRQPRMRDRREMATLV